MLGVGPFAFGYALPWALGVDPPLALQLTAIPLGLVPLTFASAIVRYRLRDVEVIIKRGLAYTAFLAASVALVPRAAEARRRSSSPTTRDPHNWIVALLATMSSCCWRSRSRRRCRTRSIACSTAIATTTAGRSSAFARDLNSDLDVVRLSQRLVTRIVETLVVDRMALMLRRTSGSGDFASIGDYGFAEPVPRAAARARRS